VSCPDEYALQAIANTGSGQAIEIILNHDIKLLGAMGNKLAIPSLLPLAQKPYDMETRKDASIALLKLDTEKGTQALIDFLQDYEKDMFSIVDFFEFFPLDWINLVNVDKYLDHFLLLLRSENAFARINTARLLAYLKRKEAIPCLIEHLDKDYKPGFFRQLDDQYEVLIQLAGFKTQEAIPGLTKIIRDAVPSKFWREASSSAWMNRKHTKENRRSYILEDLNEFSPHAEKYSDAGINAAIALASMRCREAISELHLLTKDEDIDVQIRAIWGLSTIEHPESIEILSQCLNDADLKIVYLAATSLIFTNHEIATSILKNNIWRNIEKSDFDRASSMISSLSHLKVDKALPILGSLLRLENPEIKLRTAQVLASLESPEVIPLLEPLLKDGSQFTRKYVALGLGRLGCNIALPEIVEMLYEKDNILIGITDQAKVYSFEIEKILLSLVKIILHDCKSSSKDSKILSRHLLRGMKFYLMERVPEFVKQIRKRRKAFKKEAIDVLTGFTTCISNGQQRKLFEKVKFCILSYLPSCKENLFARYPDLTFKHKIIPKLEEFARHDIEFLKQIISILSKIKTDTAKRMLKKLIEKEKKPNGSRARRMLIAETLGEFNNQKLSESLTYVLLEDLKKNIRRSSSVSIQRSHRERLIKSEIYIGDSIADCLGKIGRPSVIPELYRFQSKQNREVLLGTIENIRWLLSEARLHLLLTF
jgi:HEAT repeat protein